MLTAVNRNPNIAGTQNFKALKLQKNTLGPFARLRTLCSVSGKAVLKEYQLRMVYTRAAIRHAVAKCREHKAGW
jgi:hypothetical protein